MSIMVDIPGYENIYEINELGLVRSKDRVIYKSDGTHQNLKGKVIKHKKDHHGYPVVSLCVLGVQKQKKVHRLVALTFLGACYPGLVVAHNDGDRSNCQLTNLRYDTMAGNNADKEIHGTVCRGNKCHSAKLDEKSVLNIRSDPRKHRDIAVGYGISQSSVSLIKSFKVWKHI